MNIGIVSDTHDDLQVIEAAAERFAGHVDAVVHCGDVVAPFAVTQFDGEYDVYRRNRPSASGLDPEGEGRKLG